MTADDTTPDAGATDAPASGPDATSVPAAGASVDPIAASDAETLVVWSAPWAIAGEQIAERVRAWASDRRDEAPGVVRCTHRGAPDVWLIDIDTAANLAGTHAIVSLPTLVVARAGREHRRITGTAVIDALPAAVRTRPKRTRTPRP